MIYYVIWLCKFLSVLPVCEIVDVCSGVAKYSADAELCEFGKEVFNYAVIRLLNSDTSSRQCYIDNEN